MPFVTLTSDIQYIIGIDFGNGETSAAYCSVSDDKVPEDIAFNNKTTIATAISLDEEGVRLGFDILNSKFPNTNSRVYLKRRPTELNADPVRKELYILFVRKIYDIIKETMKKGGIVLTPANHIVFVACPSMSEDWNESEKVKYAEFMANDCGLPILQYNEFGSVEYGVFRESRAAYVKYKQDDKVKNAGDNVLVIDFGSSTVDLTYHSIDDKPIDKSYSSIGAQKVEEALITWCLSSDNTTIEEEQRDLLKTLYADSDHKGWDDKIKLEARKKKERYYEEDPYEIEIDIKPRAVTGNPNLMKSITSNINKTTLEEEILRQYKNDIKKCYKSFKEEYLVDKPISTIILTGGASRMRFMDELIEECFPNIVLYHPVNDKAASLLVSNGIAVAGKVEIKMLRMLAELLKEAPQISVDRDNIITNTAVAIAKKAMVIIDTVFSEVAQANSPYNTINKINERLQPELLVINNIASIEIGNSVGAETNVFCKEYKEKIKEGVESYFPGIDITRRINRSDVKVDGIFSAASLGNMVDVEGLTRTITQVVSTIVNGVLILVANVVLVALNTFIETINIFRSKDNQIETASYVPLEDARNVTGKDEILDDSRRKKMYEKFKEKKEDTVREIYNQIKNELDKKLDFNTISRCCQNQVRNYIVETIKDIRHLLR